jgi:hypothetical protein
MGGERVLGYAGRKLGQGIDYLAGTDRWEGVLGDTGRLAGGVIAGSPLDTAKRIRQGQLQRKYGAPDSGERFDASERLDVTPSVGSVGNKRAGQHEDHLAGKPYADERVLQAREQQYRQMDAAAQETAAQARGGPSNGPISPGSVGSHLNEAGEAASANIRNEISRPAV